MKHTNGKLIGKLGAEGIYCIGIRDINLGEKVGNIFPSFHVRGLKVDFTRKTLHGPLH